MKISHKDLENCRFSPKAWAISKQSASPSNARFAYKQALSNAICEFHRYSDLKLAINKIHSYKSLTNVKRLDMIEQQMRDYADWCKKSGVVVADSNVTLDLPSSADWRLGGEISRIDVIKSGGYRAVLFEPIVSGWKDQLRMPLIQKAISLQYGRPIEEVSVGFQDLADNSESAMSYKGTKLAEAEKEFKGIGLKVLAVLTP